MQYSSSLRCGALALFMACGPQPADPGDTDTDPTGDSPGTTSDVTTTTGEPTTGESTTTAGEPLICPEGQQSWARIAGGELELPPGVTVSQKMAAMADGRIAMAVFRTEDDRSAVGVLTLSPTGEVLDLHTGEPGAPGEQVIAHEVVHAPDNGLLVRQSRGPNGSAATGVARFAADGTPLGAFEVGPERRFPFAPVDDDVVLVSRPTQDSPSVMARMAADTGAVEWMTSIGDAGGDMQVQAMAIGPQGDVLLSGTSNQVAPTPDAAGGVTRLHVWRFDPGGEPVWSRAIDVPLFDTAHAIALGPDGLVFVLRFGPWPEGQADLVALDFATGEDRWAVTVAKADEQLRYAFISEILVDADAVSLVVARSVPDKLSLESVAVQRVSFAGELQELIPLDVPSHELMSIRALRGACGELIVLSSWEPPYWFGAFAP